MTQSYVLVRGMRYKAIPRYVSREDLDPIASFILTVALPKEPRIERLIGSFGLGERIVQDILSELIRKNYARLDVERRQIIPIANPRPIPDTVDGPPIELWQDETTSVVLLARLADQFPQPGEGRVHQLPSPPPALAPDFSSMSDAELVAVIRKYDPDSAFRSGREEWPLDRLVERVRIEPQALWVPIVEVTLQEGEERRVVPYLSSPGIPDWVSRSWCRAYESSLGREPTSDVLASLASREIKMPDQFDHDRDGARLSHAVDAWLHSIGEILHTTSLPTSRQDFRDVESKLSALKERLTSISQVGLRKPVANESSILQSVWPTDAERLTVALSIEDAEVIKRLLKVTGALPSTEASICLILSPGHPSLVTSLSTHAARLEDHLRERMKGAVDVICRQAAVTSGDYMIMDEHHLFVSGPGALLQPRPCLEIAGAAAARPLVGFVSARLPASSHLHLSALEDRNVAPRLRDAQGPTVKTILEELTRFHEVVHECAIASDIPEDSVLASLPAQKEDSGLTTGLTPDARLGDWLSRIRATLRQPVASPWAVPSRIEGTDLIPHLERLLRLSVTGKPSFERLLLLSRPVSSGRLLDYLADRFRNACAAGATIDVVFDGVQSHAQREEASLLGGRFSKDVGHARFRLRLLEHTLGLRGLVADEFVLLGGIEPCGIPGTQHPALGMSFLLEAPWLAEELRTLVESTACRTA